LIENECHSTFYVTYEHTLKRKGGHFGLLRFSTIFYSAKSSADLKELFKINRVVRFLILSDLIFLSGWGLIDPIFALFVVRDVLGATIITVGAAISVYWITKSLAQIPIAIYLDKHEGERDDDDDLGD